MEALLRPQTQSVPIRVRPESRLIRNGIVPMIAHSACYCTQKERRRGAIGTKKLAMGGFCLPKQVRNDRTCNSVFTDDLAADSGWGVESGRRFVYGRSCQVRTPRLSVHGRTEGALRKVLQRSLQTGGRQDRATLRLPARPLPIARAGC